MNVRTSWVGETPLPRTGGAPARAALSLSDTSRDVNAGALSDALRISRAAISVCSSMFKHLKR
jgi:hypothetical protein